MHTTIGTRQNPFTVRIVNKGDAYGRDNCLTHSGEPMAEFYDARYPHTPLGQFVSRYYVSTLVADRAKLCEVGLDLQGDVPDWKVSPEAMTNVFTFLTR